MSQPWEAIFVDDCLKQKLTELCELEEAIEQHVPLPNGFGALKVIVENDPDTRKARAFCMSALNGTPVAYEDGEENIVLVSMPKTSSLFPTYWKPELIPNETTLGPRHLFQ